jgi:nucleoside-diphosphate-sugar epimerase
MQAVNVDATRKLAEAAERARIPAFCYVSTVSIYGSGKGKVMAETAPTLSTDRDVPAEYWALDYVRMYGRTKLLGEKAIAAEAKNCRYTVLRPTVVVDIGDIVGIRDWGKVKRVLAAHRHSHHVYVRDVTDAVIWAIERDLGGARAPGTIETFNLSEDEYAEPRHATFLRRAYEASGDARYKVPNVPGLFDWLHDFARFRARSIRSPLWRMRFPNDRLRAAGYSLRYGMGHAYGLALAELRGKSGEGAQVHQLRQPGMPSQPLQQAAQR